MLSGGVAANSALQAAFHSWSARNGVSAFVPPPKYCTDNAAMIAAAAFYQRDAVRADPLTLCADPNLPFEFPRLRLRRAIPVRLHRQNSAAR